MSMISPKMKKKIFGLFVVFALLVVAVGYFLISRGSQVENLASQQLSLIRETVEVVLEFEKTGKAEQATQQLKNLEPKFAQWSQRQEELTKGSDQVPVEMLAEIEQLRGELANAMIQLEISDHQGAAEVLNVLEKINASASK